MKNIMIVCALVFAACGGSKKADTTTTPPDTTTTNADGSGSAAPAGEGQPCAQEVALV
jgi:hypothetical protein